VRSDSISSPRARCDGQVAGEGEEVDDPAAHGELAGAFDAGGPFVVRLDQLDRELRQIEAARRAAKERRVDLEDVDGGEFAERGRQVGHEHLDRAGAEPLGLLEVLEEHRREAEAAQVLDGLLGGNGGGDQQEGGSGDGFGRDEGVR
jgi:hypothetical protein